MVVVLLLVEVEKLAVDVGDAGVEVEFIGFDLESALQAV